MNLNNLTLKIYKKNQEIVQKLNNTNQVYLHTELLPDYTDLKKLVDKAVLTINQTLNTPD